MNLGFSEILFLSLLGLLLFGPRRLPEIGRQIGRAMNEFKRASHALQAQIEAEVRQLDSSHEVPHLGDGQEHGPTADPTTARALASSGSLAEEAASV